MSRLLKTDGVVLKCADGGKNSKLLLLLTREQGLLPVLARGAASLKSPLCAPSAQFCYSSFVLFQSGERWLVNEASVKELFFDLRLELERLSAAQVIAELALGLCAETVPDEPLLRLVLNCFYALSSLKLPPALCKAVFECRAACIEGYAPDLDACAVCGRESASGKLDTVGGRLFCPDCPAPATAIPLSEQALALLRRIGDLPDEKLFSFSASGAALRELYFAAERYLLDQTDLHPRSLKFFRSIQGETP